MSRLPQAEIDRVMDAFTIIDPAELMGSCETFVPESQREDEWTWIEPSGGLQLIHPVPGTHVQFVRRPWWRMVRRLADRIRAGWRWLFWTEADG